MQPFTPDYLGLLKMVLTRYDLEPQSRYVPVPNVQLGPFGRMVASFLQRKAYSICRQINFDSDKRLNGTDWPLEAETMIGVKRLDQLHDALLTCDREGVVGDFLEAGIWRGGAVIFAAAYLQHSGNSLSRRVVAADSFSGLPLPSDEYPADAGDQHHTIDFLRVKLDSVKENFERYSVDTRNVDFLEGWFEETLPTVAGRKIAILRLDGDMYSSTTHALDALFDSVSPGGFVIIDDYALDGAKSALHDFLASRELAPNLMPIDRTAVYFRVP